MKKAIALLFFLFAATASHGDNLSLIGVSGGGSGGSPPAVTLDPSHTATGVTLSNGNLTITSNNAGTLGIWAGSRSTTSHTTGKFYWEATTTGSSTAANYEAGGAANGSASLSAALGADNNSGAFVGSASGLFTGNALVGGSPTYAAGGTIGVAVDLGAQLIWLRNTSSPTTWNAGGTANPATGVGGISISNITGPYFIAASVDNDASLTDGVTVNFGNTAFAASAPSGFGNW